MGSPLAAYLDRYADEPDDSPTDIDCTFRELRDLHTNTVPLADYSRALDEIYALRAICAHEASVVEAHLDYATFPKGRRGVAVDQVHRLRRAAQGQAGKTYAEIGMRAAKSTLREAGASDTLTRAQWEAEKSTL